MTCIWSIHLVNVRLVGQRVFLKVILASICRAIDVGRLSFDEQKLLITRNSIRQDVMREF